MINFTVSGKKVAICSSWDDVTLSQYCKILNSKADIFETVSILSGLDYYILKKSLIIGLEDVLIAISFLRTVPEVPGYTSKVGKYNLPITKDGRFDIQFESLAQFEDTRAALNRIPVKDGKYDITGLTTAYAEFAAIYLQKLRDGEYQPEKAKAMIPEVMEMPALEVISAGSFFFLKLLSLSTGTAMSSPLTSPSPKKSKPALNSSRKSSARTAQSRKRR